MEFILDLWTLILAVIFGGLLFRHLKLFYRIIFAQCLFYLAIEICVYIINGQNHWFYNISITIEMCLSLAAAYIGLIEVNQSKNYIWIVSGVLFFSVFLLDVFFLKGVYEFAHHAAIVQGIILTMLYLWLLYQKIIDGATGKFNSALFFTSIGMIIYYACSIPYLSILFYLQKKNSEMNTELFDLTISILSQLRYLFIALSFLLASNVLYRNKLNKKKVGLDD